MEHEYWRWIDRDFAEDVYCEMLKNDSNVLAGPSYAMSAHLVSQRRSLIEWIQEMSVQSATDKENSSQKCKQFSQRCFHLAAYLFDSFADKNSLLAEHTPIFAASSFMLAAKFEVQNSTNVPSLNRMKKMIAERKRRQRCEYENGEFVDVEIFILKCAHWRLHVPLPCDFGQYFRRLCDENDLRAFSDIRFRCCKASLVAAGAVATARIYHRMAPNWPALSEITGYAIDVLNQCFSVFLNFIEQERRNNPKSLPVPISCTIPQLTPCPRPQISPFMSPATSPDQCVRSSIGQKFPLPNRIQSASSNMYYGTNYADQYSASSLSQSLPSTQCPQNHIPVRIIMPGGTVTVVTPVEHLSRCFGRGALAAATAGTLLVPASQLCDFVSNATGQRSSAASRRTENHIIQATQPQCKRFDFRQSEDASFTSSCKNVGEMQMKSANYSLSDQMNQHNKEQDQNKRQQNFSEDAIVGNDFSGLSTMGIPHRPYTRSLKRSLGALGAELLDQYNTGLQPSGKSKRSKKSCCL